ncbi:unnamed protein product, partial [Candidula unifasciata]
RTLAAPGPEKRIVNGLLADLLVHPHQASVQLKSSGGWYHACGGAVIARNKILTAAHCIEGRNVSQIRVEVGVMDLYAAPIAYKQTVGVSSLIIHTGYKRNAAGIPNDIGIIYLSFSLSLSDTVQIANLAPKGSSFAGTKCVITGWGRTGANEATSPELLEAKIPEITTDECVARWQGQNINIKHICVYDAEAPLGDRPSACMGDSGGPMMCGDNFKYLAGITSWGVSSCSGNYPSVYTRVSEYLEWIASN